MSVGEKGGGYGSRRGEHFWAEKWYTVSVGEFSDCAIVLGPVGHLRGGIKHK